MKRLVSLRCTVALLLVVGTVPVLVVPGVELSGGIPPALNDGSLPNHGQVLATFVFVFFFIRFIRRSAPGLLRWLAWRGAHGSHQGVLVEIHFDPIERDVLPLFVDNTSLPPAFLTFTHAAHGRLS